MIRVTSEVERLRRVIVQPPGVAHERMLPRNILESSPEYLLFDDLVHVPSAIAEHEQLQSVLDTVAEVFRLEDLLTEVMEHAETRQFAIEEVARLHRVPDHRVAMLEQLDAHELAQTLIVGTLGGTLDGVEMFPPVPNLIFTRDLAAVVGDTVIVGNASKAARFRESVLAWSVVDQHPLFGGAHISPSASWVRQAGGSAPLTVEGGDVLVVSSSLACIGASERTTWSMIVNLAEELLHRGFTRVLVVEMPKQRSSMHLDTVFTLVDWDRAVVYHHLLEAGGREEANIIRMRSQDGSIVIEDLEGDLLDALAHEGHPLDPVWCGGGHPIHSQREQWTDGANYVALGPGVVVGYARNHHTASEMEDAGFKVVDADGWLREFDRVFKGDADALFASGERYAIHIVGSELSRGRGGPRCLTWPLWRE